VDGFAVLGNEGEEGKEGDEEAGEPDPSISREAEFKTGDIVKATEARHSSMCEDPGAGCFLLSDSGARV